MNEEERNTTNEYITNIVLLVYNNAPHGAIGDSPFFHVFGVDSWIIKQIFPKFAVPNQNYARHFILKIIISTFLKEIKGLNG